MRYSKIINVAVHANSDRCRIQRQQCAIELLKAFKNNKRIIQIDETWVDSCDYRRRSWQVKGVSNTIPVKKIRPRISMIVAVDNRGEILFSLLQANSDSDIMELFLKELILKLDLGDRKWRSDTVLVWDGAPYHTSKEVKDVLEGQLVPLIQLGPYGYLFNTPELLFAALKSFEINFEGAPVGKR
jgi:hypothetical protein